MKGFFKSLFSFIIKATAINLLLLSLGLLVSYYDSGALSVITVQRGFNILGYVNILLGMLSIVGNYTSNRSVYRHGFYDNYVANTTNSEGKASRFYAPNSCPDLIKFFLSGGILLIAAYFIGI